MNHYPYLRVANVHRGSLDLSNLHCFELMADELRKLQLVPGDVLIVEGNGSGREIGRCALWLGEVANRVHQNHVIRVRPFNGLVPKYMETRMLHKALAREIARPTNTGLFGLIGHVCIFLTSGDEDTHAARAPFASLRTPGMALYSQPEPMMRDARCMQVTVRCNETGGEIFLNSPLGQIAIQHVANSTSDLYTLSVGKIKRLPLALHPRVEQEAIVEVVEAQLSVIDQLEFDLDAKLTHARSLRQAILRHAFTGKLVPQEPNDELGSEILNHIAAERETRAREARTAQRTRSSSRRR